MKSLCILMHANGVHEYEDSHSIRHRNMATFNSCNVIYCKNYKIYDSSTDVG
jgi:hypothetical protein